MAATMQRIDKILDNWPDESAKQWEILLLLITGEEKDDDRTTEKEVDTVNYFYTNECIRELIRAWLREMAKFYAKKTSEKDTALKCDEVSLLWRQQGNESFRAERYQRSYRCYSKSVKYAPQDGLMFPLALANRSAALLKMKRFQESLSDLELALEQGYPAEQRLKLLLRRVECHIGLQQREKGFEALEMASEYARFPDHSAQYTAEHKQYIKQLKKKLSLLEPPPADEQESSPPPVRGGDNPDFVAASTALQLRRSDARGRYVVTRERLQRGDVIFSEQPYAWVALPSRHPVCEGCCRDLTNPLPCAQCSRSVYCSMSCRARAQPIHRWECAGAQANLFKTIGIAHLALRVLLVTAIEGFPPVPPSQPAPSSAGELFTSYSQVDDLNIYSADTPAFYRMFNLVTNFDKMNNSDYIQYALTATMLTLYLEHHTEFFEFLPSRVPYSLSETELKMFTAALLLRAIGQLVCNGHATLSLVVEDDDITENTVSEREVRRATAIYPSAAMMNHSCDPNIINTFYNGRLIVRCSRDIGASSLVANCYGPHWARMPTAQRRAQLRAQYYFNCECLPCSDDENNIQYFAYGRALVCQSCKGPVQPQRSSCELCDASLARARIADAVDHADELLARAVCQKSLEKRCELTYRALRVKQQVWYRYHEGLRQLSDSLARLYADLGDFSKSVDLIKQNIQGLESQFGSFSGEVAHELRKLSDVMLERIRRSPQSPDYRDWCLEAYKVIKKAYQVMELNYGYWEPLVKRLKEQESLVAALLFDSQQPGDDCVHHNLHYNLKI